MKKLTGKGKVFQEKEKFQKNTKKTMIIVIIKKINQKKENMINISIPHTIMVTLIMTIKTKMSIITKIETIFQTQIIGI